MRIRDRERLERILRRRKKQSSVEVCCATVERSDRPGNRLNDLTVISGIEMAHLIPIEQIDAAFLASAYHQMPVSRTADLIWKQEGSARTEVDVSAVQAQLVEGGE